MKRTLFAVSFLFALFSICLLPAKAATEDIGWPSSGVLVDRLPNMGIVINGAYGDEVVSPVDGIVDSTGKSMDGHGEMVVMRTSANELIVVSGLVAAYVKKGESIRAGHLIGAKGATKSGEIRLSLAVTVNGVNIDPLTRMPIANALNRMGGAAQRQTQGANKCDELLEHSTEVAALDRVVINWYRYDKDVYHRIRTDVSSIFRRSRDSGEIGAVDTESITDLASTQQLCTDIFATLKGLPANDITRLNDLYRQEWYAALRRAIKEIRWSSESGGRHAFQVYKRECALLSGADMLGLVLSGFEVCYFLGRELKPPTGPAHALAEYLIDDLPIRDYARGYAVGFAVLRSRTPGSADIAYARDRAQSVSRSEIKSALAYSISEYLGDSQAASVIEYFRSKKVSELLSRSRPIFFDPSQYLMRTICDYKKDKLRSSVRELDTWCSTL